MGFAAGERGLDPSLETLAAECGVETRYADVRGTVRRSPEDAVLVVLKALGEPVERVSDCAEALRCRRSQPARLPPVLVAWNGELPVLEAPPPRGSGATRIRIRFENGAEQTMMAGARTWRNGWAMPGPLPLGLHEVELEEGDEVRTSRIVSAPRIAWRPSRPRTWGAFVALHALGPGGTSLPGSYTDLARLLEWVGEAGGAWVGLLPLLPTFLDGPFEPSPYAPISRMFLSELYIDPAAALAEAGEPGPCEAPGPADDPAAVDYAAAWTRLRHTLFAPAQRFFKGGGGRSARFQRFLLEHPAAQDYARFRAAARQQDAVWRNWPERIRHGRLRRGDFDPAEYRFHLFATWCAHEQMATAVERGGPARPFLDLPLGVHPDGYDTWRLPHLFAHGVDVGAPPDAFQECGQNWGFPPIIPPAQRADGYSYFLECLRLHLRYAGALRLDHVMSLERLFWVPEGCEPSEGVYVRYPREELIALISLESHRHESMIVGEDLGTVTPSIRSAMTAHALQRLFVVQFEAGRPGPAPFAVPDPDSVASIGTHDLPTFAAWLRGLDIDQDVALGRTSRDGAAAIREDRERAVAELCRALDLADCPGDAALLLRAVLARLAASPARVVMVNLEDAWLETQRMNLPGTTSEHPNWRRRAPFDADSIRRDSRVAGLLDLVNRERRDSAPAAGE